MFMDPDKRLELVQQLEAKIEELRSSQVEAVVVGGGAVEVAVDHSQLVRREG